MNLLKIYRGIFIDEKKKEKVGSYDLPVLKNGDWMLNDHPIPLVDSFADRTNYRQPFL